MGASRPSAGEGLPSEIEPLDLLRILLHESREAVLLSDAVGKILLFNRAAERLWAQSADGIVGRLCLSDLCPPGVWEDLQRRLSRHGGEAPERLEPLRTEILGGEGLRVPVELWALDLGGASGVILWFLRDLRAQVDLEEGLARAQRYMELGERRALLADLGGTAAHELNQPLTSILGHADLMRRRAPSASPEAATLDIILREAGRMAEIVRKIGRVTRYETKAYVGDSRIVDLEQAAAREKSGAK